MFGGYLFNYCCVIYPLSLGMWEGIPVKRLTPKSYLKSFSDAPKSHKHQLTCPLEITSGSFLIGRRRILVIPWNHLVTTIIITTCQTSLHGSLVWAVLHAPSHFGIFSMFLNNCFRATAVRSFRKFQIFLLTKWRRTKTQTSQIDIHCWMAGNIWKHEEFDGHTLGPQESSKDKSSGVRCGKLWGLR